MNKPMTPLPIDRHLSQVTDSLRRNPRLVLVAPPGSGKTTRVPAAILEAGLIPDDRPALVVLEPRRLAARSSARRIARERGWTLGEQVGYQVRFEKRIGPKTPLRFVTEGILTRQLLSDPRWKASGESCSTSSTNGAWRATSRWH
jgi:ATP-dependent helicase HrpB